MVVLNRIYTRTGDKGETALGSGVRVPKYAARIEAFGTVDETNAAIGVARLATEGELDAMLARIQNDLFDLGADLCVPESKSAAVGAHPPLRIAMSQVDQIEQAIDRLNAELSPLRSFVLPGGTGAAAALHLARTICRRAERQIVALAAIPGEIVGAPALAYINRLSGILQVAEREGNRNQFVGQLTLSSAGVGGILEGPIRQMHDSLPPTIHRVH